MTLFCSLGRSEEFSKSKFFKVKISLGKIIIITSILGIISQAFNLLIALWRDSLLIFPFCQWKKRYKRKETACGRHGGMLLRAPWVKGLAPSCQQTAFSFRVCSTAETHITHSHALPGHLMTEWGQGKGLGISAWSETTWTGHPCLRTSYHVGWDFDGLFFDSFLRLALLFPSSSLPRFLATVLHSKASQCLLWEKPTCNTTWSQVASKQWSWASDTSSLL